MAKQKEKRPESAAIGSAFAETSLGQISDWEIIKRLWTYMRPYRLTFLSCLLLLPVLSGLQLIQPHILQLAIDQHFVTGDFNGIEKLFVIFGIAIIGQAFVQFTQFYLMQRAAQFALRDMRNRVFKHVQTLSVSFFHRNPVGRLMARMTTDIENLQEALSSGMVTMIGDLFTLTAIVVILLVKSWQLALISFVVLPFLVGLTAIFRFFLRRAFRAVRVKIARLYSHLQESISGMPIIQLFVRENVSADEYAHINAEHRDANYQAIRFDAALYSIVEMVGSITVGLIIWYGAGEVIQDVVTIGVLIAFVEYMQKFFIPIRDLAQKYNMLQGAMAASEKVFQLLDEDDCVPNEGSETEISRPATLSFDHVSFAYVDDDLILDDVSFSIAPGERIAIVGHTGAGKSTITNLALRLYDTTAGSVRLNGVDIRDIERGAYRKLFAIVLQDVFLFQGSIADNISLSATGVTRDDVEAAATHVQADALIRNYDDGYEHQILERGSNLSAGEKQLLAFARALAVKPEILILDEATANVDTETEALVQEAIDRLLQNQTSIVIAHRLSTIRKADRILVLQNGKIVEQGSHEALMASGGQYQKLYQLQYAAQESD